MIHCKRGIKYGGFGKVRFDSALEKALLSLSGLGVSLKLRSEEKKAVMTLLSRRDLLAIYQTGFGKSLFF